ncbi:hypothetical protein CXB51_010739 [Gossypium anomalum]|uniref:GIR1-like zinc ribbon domain-containing protein n=1 Tax=Gossypium anomalum TaxID=47600 RepID=A0A8J6CZL8_9ROSI|nr:hypothetical protein CXB51_010739 [Gossypium anomalum]
MDDVRSTNTTLISSVNDTTKNCSNINQSAKHNEEYHQVDARKICLIEIGKEENERSIDLNLELTPTGLPSKICLSTNQCLEISSTSLSATSHMLRNQQDSSSEEVEFNNIALEEPSLVVMGCSRCLMYVMACKINPKCANCQTSYHLIDVIHNNPLRNQRMLSLF